MSRSIDADNAIAVMRSIEDREHRKKEGTISDAIKMLSSDVYTPTLNVVEKSVYDQVCWERDTALEQLKEIGKSLGEKMDDVRAVVLCKDCKHFYNTNDTGWCDIHSHFFYGDWNFFSESDYCSYGERKDK